MLPYYLSGLKKIFSVSKKAFLVFIVFSAVIALFSYFINKDKETIRPQRNIIAENQKAIYKVINDKKLNSTKEGKSIIALYKGSMCLIMGEACTDNPKDADKNYQKSIFGFMTKLIVIPFENPPASGIAWISSGLQSAGFLNKTWAAEGIGLSAIKPFANIWKIFRDISYMFLVIVLIAIGFMIMFRMKMNPQTVISVENALPKIIISLILITFSFAIAGFLIDLVYILIGLIVSILSNNNIYYDATIRINEYMMATPSQLWLKDLRVNLPWTQSISGQIGKALFSILPLEAEIIIRSLIGIVMVILVHSPINSFMDPLSRMLSGWQGGTFGWGEVFYGLIKTATMAPLLFAVFTASFFYLAIPVFMLLIFFSILFLFFRILLLLFSNYLKLILLIIISPFLLLFEAVPGKSALRYWITNMIGNLLIFPLTIGIFCLSNIILNNISSEGFSARLPYLYGIQGDGFRVLVATGLVFLIPELYKLLKESLGIKDLPISIGLGTFFGGVKAGVGGATGLLGQFGSISLGIQALTGRSVHEIVAGKDGSGGIFDALARRVKKPDKDPTQKQS